MATDSLADRMVGATTSALELFSIHLGRELGLYGALAEAPLSYPELAERAGIAARYAQEWLEQQAVAGVLEAVPGRPDTAEHRRYLVPDDHRPALLDPDDPFCMGIRS